MVPDRFIAMRRRHAGCPITGPQLVADVQNAADRPPAREVLPEAVTVCDRPARL